MGVLPSNLRKSQAKSDVQAQANIDYPSPLDINCSTILMQIKSIEIRLKELPTIILTADTAYTLYKLRPASFQERSSRSIPTYSARMVAQSEKEVLTQLLIDKKAIANKWLCFEEAKAAEIKAKNQELNTLITDSTTKFKTEISTETKKINTKNLFIGSIFLLSAITVIIIFKTKAK